ncbi:MAG TPA: RNA polymerase sigma factor [Solirubrobacteraceae bacterium]|nr:RNA polymerase sigma factor [Solirubrobacteraceae bacterium]
MSDAESIAVPMPRARRAHRRGDAALLRAVDRGDEAALAELFRRHWPAIHRAAWLVTHDAQAAEDIAQEAFLAALQRLDSFDRQRPFRPWLHRIVVNRAVDFVRARAARHEVAAAGLPEPIATEPRTLDDDTVAALARLGPDQRAVVVLRHLLGYTPGQIAGLLDVPRGTVNSRLRRALDELAGELDT